VAFRASNSRTAPSGWSIVLKKTVLGKEYLHGINFPIVGKPMESDVKALVQTARKVFDKEVSRGKIIVTPQQFRDIPLGKVGGIGGIRH
jgi:hypothetical protein